MTRELIWVISQTMWVLGLWLLLYGLITYRREWIVWAGLMVTVGVAGSFVGAYDLAAIKGVWAMAAVGWGTWIFCEFAVWAGTGTQHQKWGWLFGE